MSRVCEICGKSPVIGGQVARRGIAKKKGGIGLKTTGRSKRIFKPNLQKVKAVINNKTVRIRVCTACLKAGKIVKPG